MGLQARHLFSQELVSVLQAGEIMVLHRRWIHKIASMSIVIE